MRVTTRDGERLAAWLVDPPAAGPADVGVVVAHGFSGSLDRDEVQQIARAFAAYGAVLVPSLRGHGTSSGVSTLGDREVLDVDACVALLRGRGHRRVVTTGWSMGGSAVLRHAGLVGTRVHGSPVEQRPDAVVAVSTTSGWDGPHTPAMRRLRAVAGTLPGRAVARRMGARVDPAGWATVPVSPVEAVRGLDGVPLLVVQGGRDHYFHPRHGRALAAADPTAELWEVESLGHAEQAVVRDPALLARIAAHVPVLLARGPAALT